MIVIGEGYGSLGSQGGCLFGAASVRTFVCAVLVRVGRGPGLYVTEDHELLVLEYNVLYSSENVGPRTHHHHFFSLANGLGIWPLGDKSNQ